MCGGFYDTMMEGTRLNGVRGLWGVEEEELSDDNTLIEIKEEEEEEEEKGEM